MRPSFLRYWYGRYESPANSSERAEGKALTTIILYKGPHSEKWAVGGVVDNIVELESDPDYFEWGSLHTNGISFYFLLGDYQKGDEVL